MKKIVFLSLLVYVLLTACNQQPETVINYTDSFKNVNHPIIGYWFFTPDLLENERYLTEVEDLAKNSPYDLIYLTPRNGIDYYDTVLYQSVFDKLVKKAVEYSVGIGGQIFLVRHGSDYQWISLPIFILN